jgi:hypothetical protein
MSHPPAQALSAVEFNQLSNFRKKNMLGYGRYGFVYKGMFRDAEVAIKQSRVRCVFGALPP